MSTLKNIPQTMNIPLFIGAGRIEYGTKATPTPGPGQLLLEVKANALCGSDRSQFFDGSTTTPGHEASGIVVAAGEGAVTPIGTPGVAFLMDFCGECRSCKSGFTNQCFNKRADYGFTHDGGYGPYMVINESVFYPVDPSIPLTEATMILDIMGTGGHAIKRAKLVHKDIRSMLIAGAGPIGLGVLAMAKILLCTEIPVFIMDFVPYRLDLAKQMGGIPIHLGNQSLAESVQAAGLKGVDAAIDTSGKTAARQSALDSLNQRGVLICVGHGEQLNLKVSADLIATERSVLGSEYFQYHELEENHELLKKHLPYLSQIITHRFGLDKIQEAYELFFQGNTGKVVIEH
ncbi:alcohol dehydrogenase catalytic domain-containing protein [Paenibacillus sp. 5J-6]|uniref:Alcohol dehydrogenase catalytic domain-containing protein n=1 Tax=Paenibacillus silvestris TaxID=2606219 RepID=A0A6L8V7A4_9BACL|nr:zinc-binding dehydrogenase [Paenibacillus silvestris]MZQ86258.1 alcohol dehydrogenase catalytic domain-containing protein [Paenibacillus silvestris]